MLTPRAYDAHAQSADYSFDLLIVPLYCHFLLIFAHLPTRNIDF